MQLPDYAHKYFSDHELGLKQKLYEVVAVVKDSPKVKTRDLAKKMGVSVRTVARYLKVLQDLGIARFEGAPKTGGYVLSNDFLKNIER